MKLIDSHCHLNHPVLLKKINEVISCAEQVGVSGFIIPGVTASGWQGILRLTRGYSICHGAAGLHPLFIKDHRGQDLHLLEEICKTGELTAIGEIGLDFYQGRETQEQQQQLFKDQLRLAGRYNLPVIIHVRKAHDKVLATLRRSHFKSGGVVHAFNGSLQQAEQYISLGFCLGVGGVISYERATKIRSTVKDLPLDSIVLETDSPDMPLAGNKNCPNLPQYLPEVLEILADLKAMDKKDVAQTTHSNTLKLFNITKRNDSSQ